MSPEEITANIQQSHDRSDELQQRAAMAGVSNLSTTWAVMALCEEIRALTWATRDDVIYEEDPS